MTEHAEKTTEQIIEALGRRADRIQNIRKEKSSIVPTNTSVMVDLVKELECRKEEVVD